MSFRDGLPGGGCLPPSLPAPGLSEQKEKLRVHGERCAHSVRAQEPAADAGSRRFPLGGAEGPGLGAEERRGDTSWSKSQCEDRAAAVSGECLAWNPGDRDFVENT